MKKSLLTLISLLMIASFALAACGAPAAPATEAPVVEAPKATEAPKPTEVPATEAPAGPDGQLTIWADETRAPILEELAPAFLEAYNIELVIVVKSALRDDFQVAAPVGEGPDILFGVAHDQGGTMVANGLLAEVDLGEKAADFLPASLDACSYEGKLYCMPYATENLGFFYNTELVGDTAPATWDEVVSIGEQLKADGKVTYILSVTGTTYDIYPLFTAFGGYIFGKDANGIWNDQDLGVDNEGMIAANTWLKENVDNGNLPTDWDWANNHALFEGGETPFIMAGPWALDRIRESGVPYKVAEFFPAGPGGAGAPFAGTQGIFISAQSENILLAQAFLTEFVATEEVMQKLFEVGKRPSAYLPVRATIEDPDLLAMAKAGETATMMPSIPAMGSVWTSWNDGIVLARDGKLAPDAALLEAGTKIRALIANPLTGMVNVPGSYQAAAGCASDWDPTCAVTAMAKGEDGKWASGPFALKAGDYEAKVALDGAWTTNYGVDGKQDGDNYKFSLTADAEVSFVFDPATNLLEIVVK